MRELGADARALRDEPGAALPDAHGLGALHELLKQVSAGCMHGSVVALVPLDALVPLGALGALIALVALVTLVALPALVPWVALVPLVALCALVPLVFPVSLNFTS